MSRAHSASSRHGHKLWTFTNNMNMRDLSSDDDFLSYMLIETFGTGHTPLTVHKMDRTKKLPQFDSEQVMQIVKRWLLFTKTTAAKRIRGAVDALLQVPAVQQYTRHMHTSQINAFATHAARYLEIYLPTSTTEIAQTSRYSHRTGKAELCILSTQHLPIGTVITELKGSMAELTDAENEELKRTDRRSNQGARRDFSVIHSGHRKKNHLFLGPARFVNHDCDNNCDLIREGRYITFRVIKPIAPGEEITAHYGSSYFGKRNRHCLCETCEKSGRGGYRIDPYTDSDHSSESDVSEDSDKEKTGALQQVQVLGAANERRTRRGVYTTLPSSDSETETSGDSDNSSISDSASDEDGPKNTVEEEGSSCKNALKTERNVIQIADGLDNLPSTLTPISRSPSSPGPMTSPLSFRDSQQSELNRDILSGPHPVNTDSSFINNNTPYSRTTILRTPESQDFRSAAEPTSPTTKAKSPNVLSSPSPIPYTTPSRRSRGSQGIVEQLITPTNTASEQSESPCPLATETSTSHIKMEETETLLLKRGITKPKAIGVTEPIRSRKSDRGHRTTTTSISRRHISPRRTGPTATRQTGPVVTNVPHNNASRLTQEVPIPKKRGRKPRPPKTCDICSQVLVLPSTGSRNQAAPSQCARCQRHFAIFGANWPSRIPLSIPILPSPSPEPDPEMRDRYRKRILPTLEDSTGREVKRRKLDFVLPRRRGRPPKNPQLSHSVRHRLSKHEMRRRRKNERRRDARASAKLERQRQVKGEKARLPRSYITSPYVENRPDGENRSENEHSHVLLSRLLWGRRGGDDLMNHSCDLASLSRRLPGKPGGIFGIRMKPSPDFLAVRRWTVLHDSSIGNLGSLPAVWNGLSELSDTGTDESEDSNCEKLLLQFRAPLEAAPTAFARRKAFYRDYRGEDTEIIGSDNDEPPPQSYRTIMVTYSSSNTQCNTPKASRSVSKKDKSVRHHRSGPSIGQLSPFQCSTAQILEITDLEERYHHEDEDRLPVLDEFTEKSSLANDGTLQDCTLQPICWSFHERFEWNKETEGTGHCDIECSISSLNDRVSSGVYLLRDEGEKVSGLQEPPWYSTTKRLPVSSKTTEACKSRGDGGMSVEAFKVSFPVQGSEEGLVLTGARWDFAIGAYKNDCNVHTSNNH